MKSEMPKSLSTIEKASNCLEEASSDLNKDPYSQVQICRDKGTGFQNTIPSENFSPQPTSQNKFYVNITSQNYLISIAATF